MKTEIRAEITGTVWKVEVAEGARVAEGDTVVILESMKMEVPVESPASGTVLRLLVAPGQAIEDGDVLLEVE